MGITSLTPITKMMADLPLVLLSHQPRNGLVICFGMGTTFRSMLSWGVDTTGVDLVPSVPATFGYYFSDASQLVKSPNAHIVIDDGRRFLDRSAKRYDVIVIDPPPPVPAAGSSLLYSREFYTVAKAHLVPGGILAQWLPYADPAVQASFAKAISESFPYVKVYGSVEGWGWHFLASEQPIPETSAEVAASRMPQSAVADMLEWGPYRTPQLQFRAVLSRQIPIQDLIAKDPSVSTLSDNRPINEYFLLRETLPQSWFGQLP
jgi:spermidine synthase